MPPPHTGDPIITKIRKIAFPHWLKPENRRLVPFRNGSYRGSRQNIPVEKVLHYDRVDSKMTFTHADTNTWWSVARAGRSPV